MKLSFSAGSIRLCPICNDYLGGVTFLADGDEIELSCCGTYFVSVVGELDGSGSAVRIKTRFDPAWPFPPSAHRKARWAHA